jgi:LAO/AO transport system kinase
MSQDTEHMESTRLLQDLQAGNRRMLARGISWVENQVPGYRELLRALPADRLTAVPVIGFTGPPGAGKSTLVDRIIGEMVSRGHKIAVLCVDPSSPFHYGALLGDRVRMSNWFNHPSVYIRSLASRGSLGGLHARIIEITDLLKAAGFDYILVETVGVGQSEVEIAGLADTTVVVLVPEAGDEIQTMKAGLMEIADVFVVNKGDRPGADLFVRNLRRILSPDHNNGERAAEVFLTTATSGGGIASLAASLLLSRSRDHKRKSWLLAERAYQLIVSRRMEQVSRAGLREKISEALTAHDFNLYRFIENY